MKSITEYFAFLEEATGVRLTLVDLGGIPHGAGLHRNFQIKDRPFCAAVKSTPKGLRACLRCKRLSNQKALSGCFFGCCPFGAQEIVTPVYLQQRPAGILYTGNFTTDPALSAARYFKNGAKTGAPADPAIPQSLAFGHTLPFYQQLAAYAADALAGFLKNTPPAHTPLPHLIQNVLLLIEREYYRPLSVQEAARECYVNPQYLGRQVLRVTGSSFTTLLNQKRIDAACSLLLKEDITILETAMRCGYENVTYFNRAFKQLKGCAPSVWRQNHVQ